MTGFVIYDFSLRAPKLLLAKMYVEECVDFPHSFTSLFSGKTASLRKLRDKTHKEKKYKRECVVEG